MATVMDIPSYGFARGAIVRHRKGGPNMLVVRGLGATTAVVLCEDDAGGTLRLREYRTRDLVEQLGHNQAGPPLPAHDWAQDAAIIADLAKALQEPGRADEVRRHHRALLEALNASHTDGEQDALAVFEAVAQLLAQLIGGLPDDAGRAGTLRYIATRADVLHHEALAAGSVAPVRFEP